MNNTGSCPKRVRFTALFAMHLLDNAVRGMQNPYKTPTASRSALPIWRMYEAFTAFDVACYLEKLYTGVESLLPYGSPAMEPK
jgi:hypothetical protein